MWILNVNRVNRVSRSGVSRPAVCGYIWSQPASDILVFCFEMEEANWVNECNKVAQDALNTNGIFQAADVGFFPLVLMLVVFTEPFLYVL